mgnify:CR=1 FL=1
MAACFSSNAAALVSGEPADCAIAAVPTNTKSKPAMAATQRLRNKLGNFFICSVCTEYGMAFTTNWLVLQTVARSPTKSASMRKHRCGRTGGISFDENYEPLQGIVNIIYIVEDQQGMRKSVV